MQPKGSIVVECGNALLKNGYKLKILNTINFKKSMHYNPFAYVHSEKDILKLVTTLMTNTKGEGSGGDPFWEKSERLLLTALIAYLHYEAPVEEQNFATLLEMLNTMQVLEDDEEYQNPVDLRGPKPIPFNADAKALIPSGELALTMPNNTAQLDTTTSLAEIPAISATAICQKPRPMGAKKRTSHLPSMDPKLWDISGE